MPKKKRQKSLSFKRPQFLVAIVFALAIAAFGTYKLTSSNASSVCIYNTYSKGARGKCVEYIQHLINWELCEYGSSSCRHLTVDGIFGPNTQAYVYWLQATRYIPVNGRVDGHVWKKLCNPNAYPWPAWVTWSRAAAGCWPYVPGG
jgi:hypothetical protein